MTILISGNRSNILQILTVGFLFSSNSTRVLIISLVASILLLYDEVLMLFDFTALLRVIELFSVEKVIALESEPGRRLHVAALVPKLRYHDIIIWHRCRSKRTLHRCNLPFWLSASASFIP